MRIAVCVISFALLFSGCSKNLVVVNERSNPLFLEGKSYLQQSKTDKALESFLCVIKQRDSAPESHLEVGYIYLYTLNNPYYAIYHFNESLKCGKNDLSIKRQELINGLIDTAKKKIIAAMPGNISDNVDNKKLIDVVRMTRDENVFLQKKIKSYEDRMDAIINSQKQEYVANVKKQNSIANKSENNIKTLYIVRSGDTLSTISLKFYGVSSDWKKVYEANRDTLKSPTKLKIGQEIVIP